MAARIRGLGPGAHRQRRAQPVAARCLRRGHGRAASGARAAVSAATRPAGHCSAIARSIWRRSGTSRTRASGRCAAPRQHFTHSKVMAWVAFDRAVKSVESLRPAPAPIERWRAHARARSTTTSAPAASTRELGSFVQAYGSQGARRQPAAAAAVGFLPPRRSARARHGRGDRARPCRRRPRAPLRQRQRRRRAAAGRRRCSSPCSFWLADAYVLLRPPRRGARAVRAAARAAQRRRPACARNTTRAARRLLGNFPQAFSHVALVNTATILPTARKPAEQRSDDARRRRGGECAGRVTSREVY